MQDKLLIKIVPSIHPPPPTRSLQDRPTRGVTSGFQQSRELCSSCSASWTFAGPRLLLPGDRSHHWAFCPRGINNVEADYTNMRIAEPLQRLDRGVVRFSQSVRMLRELS